MSDSLRPHELQHARPPCPSPTPGVHPNSCPSSRWCHPAISSSVVPFSSCPQSLPASESFPMSQLFTWGGQSTGVSALASFLPKNTQDWSPLEWTGWISLQSKDSQESSPTPHFKIINSSVLYVQIDHPCRKGIGLRFLVNINTSTSNLLPFIFFTQTINVLFQTIDTHCV